MTTPQLALPCPVCAGPMPTTWWRAPACPTCWERLCLHRYDLARAVMDTWQPERRQTAQHRKACETAISALTSEAAHA